MEVLNEPQRYAPEQVFYIKKLTPGTTVSLISCCRGARATDSRSPTTPSPCPTQSAGSSTTGSARRRLRHTRHLRAEGYTAEKKKGHVRSLASGARETFTTRLGCVDRRRAADLARSITQSAEGA
jgi:hypothetical protein